MPPEAAALPGENALPTCVILNNRTVGLIMAQTCAVLVRGMQDEAPFLHEFIEHYINLGFQRVYYINTSGSRAYIDQCLPAQLMTNLVVLDAPNTTPNWQLSAVNAALESVKEDWFLNVDLDEFLFLGGRTIGQFLYSIPENVSVIRFSWHLVLSTAYAEASVKSITSRYQSRSLQFKTMALTKNVSDCGLHDVKTLTPSSIYSPRPYEDHARLVHFACRGLYDLVNRIVDRNYEDAKSAPGEIERLKSFFYTRDQREVLFPFRFNLYRVELSFPSHVVPFRTSQGFIHSGTNIDLLHATFRDKMAKIGVALPINLEDVDLSTYIENTFCLRSRLMRNLPGRHFSELHFERRLSYQNITHAYIRTLRDREYQ